MADKPFLLVRNLGPGAGMECQGKQHSGPREVGPGESLSLVVRTELFAKNPGDPAGRAYLCDACVTKLGNRIERLEFTGAATPQIPGPDVESF